MTSKERIRAAIEHRQPDRLPVDFGASPVTGIHCSVVEQLRRHYKLESRPVKICEPYQMLGLVEDDLREAIGIDTIPVFTHHTLFGFANENWKPWRTPWGQEVLVSEHFEVDERPDGVYIHPQGNRAVAPSGHMPSKSYFFDAMIRQQPIDEDNLSVDDNLEEFGPMSAEEEAHWLAEARRVQGSDAAVVGPLNGTALGDIALVPAPFLAAPKGVRDVEQWYMTVAAEPEFVMEIFDRQVEIALGNLIRLKAVAGNFIDVAVVCGADFGTQQSTFFQKRPSSESGVPATGGSTIGFTPTPRGKPLSIPAGPSRDFSRVSSKRVSTSSILFNAWPGGWIRSFSRSATAGRSRFGAGA